jgi:Jacalin-like lectin domain
LNFQFNYIPNRTDLIQQNKIHSKLKYAGYQYSGSEWDDSEHRKIIKIIVGAGMSIITSIRVVYEEPNGTIKLASEHGGVSRFSKVVIL